MCRGQFDDALQSWKICAGTGSGVSCCWSKVVSGFGHLCVWGSFGTCQGHHTSCLAGGNALHTLLGNLLSAVAAFFFRLFPVDFEVFFFSPKRSDRLHASTRDFWLGLDLACLQFLHNYILEPFGVYGVCHVILCNLWWMVPHKGQHLKIFWCIRCSTQQIKSSRHTRDPNDTLYAYDAV